MERKLIVEQFRHLSDEQLRHVATTITCILSTLNRLVVTEANYERL